MVEEITEASMPGRSVMIMVSGNNDRYSEA